MMGDYFKHIYRATATAIAAASSGEVISNADFPDIPNAEYHEIDAWMVGGTVGSAQVWFLPFHGDGTTYVRALDKYGAAVSINMASGSRMPIRLNVTAKKIKLIPSGADGTWGYGIVGRSA